MSDLMELVNECSAAADHPASRQPTETIDRLLDLGFTKASDKLLQESWRKVQLYRIGQEKYPVITNAKIGAFLDRKVEAYNKEHKPKKRAKSDDFTAETANLEIQMLSAADLLEHPQAWVQQYNAAQRRFFNGDLGAWNGASTPPPTGPLDYGHLGHGLLITRETCDYRNSDGIGKFIWQETTLADYAGIPPDHVLQMLRNVKDKTIFDYFTIAQVNEVKDPLLLGRLNGHADRWFLSQWGDDVSLDDVI